MTITKNNFLVWGEGKPNNEAIPKIIWLYWVGKSELVNRCIAKIKSLHPNFEINILNPTNLKNYLPNLTGQNLALPLANYTDLIRLALLQKYGGIWMDASILLTENLDWVYKIKTDFSTDIVGFYADFITTNTKYPILETWFLAAPKNNTFITNWFNIFNECYISEYPQIYFNDLMSNTNFMQGIDEALGKYLICYIAAMKLMRSSNNYIIAMLPASNSAHYYNFKLKLKPHQLTDIFLLNKEISKYPSIIKFEKRGRQAIDEAIERGQYDRNSLLYKISPDPHYLKNKFPKYFKYLSFITQNILKKLK